MLNKRLINTGVNAIAGPTGATLEALGFGGDSYPVAWQYGIDAHDGLIYNINRDSFAIGISTWPPPVFSATYTTTYPNPYKPLVISRESDGNFLVVITSLGTKRYNPSFVEIDTLGGSGWDITATDIGYAATDTSNWVYIYDNTGGLLNMWIPSQGGTSAYNGIAWDGSGLWVSSETSIGSGTGGVCYKYDLNGNYTGYSFPLWADRPFATMGYDPIQEKFYGFQRPSGAAYGGTIARYGATFN
jgi:hypothetical protein